MSGRRVVRGTWSAVSAAGTVAVRLVLLALLGAPLAATASAQPSPLDRAHAHNDYEHARPLLDALERGYGSVEADVHLVDGALLVAHDRDSVRADRTLEALYLDPLRAWIAAHGGRVHAGRPPLTLLVDVKSNADSTWPVLDATLRRYADLLTVVRGDTVVEGAVTAIVSGERPLVVLPALHERRASLDGRLPDLDGPAAPAIPLVSDDWKHVTKWRGDGPAPRALRRRVARLAARAHARGQRLRFWGTPDRPVVWRLLYDAGVDLIGADDLGALAAFLSTRPAPADTSIRRRRLDSRPSRSGAPPASCSVLPESSRPWWRPGMADSPNACVTGINEGPSVMLLTYVHRIV